MTAEIAILNKSAVALAADSALAISHRNGSPKIYNSEHKLFQLSLNDPIGIMINNDMSFMEIPLPVIIFKYREQCGTFKHLAGVAENFRLYLKGLASKASLDVQSRQLIGHVRPDLIDLNEDILNAVQQGFFSRRLRSGSKSTALRNDISISELIDQAIEGEIVNFRRRLSDRNMAEHNGDSIQLSDNDKEIIETLISQVLEIPDLPKKHVNSILQAIVDNIYRVDRTTTTTGIVISGFGSDDLFPTLVAFDLHGYIGGALRYKVTECVDIDREGPKARVLPFAQKEMVERLIHGVDDSTFEQMTTTFRALLDSQRIELLNQIELSSPDRQKLRRRAENANKKIFASMVETMRAEMLEKSRQEIDSMVEFMPKSELAEMAEALVNITLIKRRVSNVIETVGGPIDVCVISRSEGFVWVRHKHYFPPGLNPGYYKRNGLQLGHSKEAP